MTDLRLEGVDKRFGETPALEDVSISVEDGEFFTLVGPSGCGKTTTLRIVAGLTEPTAGSVFFGGRDMAGVPPEDRHIGIVFQNYALFPHMTVGENVAYGLRFSDPPRGQSTADRVTELLDLVDLAGMHDREPDQLSGGQQQRVALARALAPGPELLLLDEPMSALDARLRDRLRRTVREIQTELGITTLYVTHDQAEALAISDRIAVLHGGRVEQVGSPEDVYREPASRFVAGFVGDNNLFEVDRIETDDTSGTLAISGGLEIAVDSPVSAGTLLAVRPEAMHLGPDDTSFEIHLQTVEFHGDGYKLHGSVDDRDLVVKTATAPSADREVIGFPTEAVQVIPDSGSSN